MERERELEDRSIALRDVAIEDIRDVGRDRARSIAIIVL